MAQVSLRTASIAQETPKRYVERCLRSYKHQKVFCLVEGELDLEIYRGRLNQAHIEVNIAVGENKKAGYAKVMQYVHELRHEQPRVRVIGIRDKDYSILLGHPYPDGVYHTDYRDIEMTILAAPSFLASDSTLMDKLAQVIPYCRHLAYLRIFNESHGRICNINAKVKIASVYDDSNRQYHADWQSLLDTTFIENSQPAYAQEDIDNYIHDQNLDSYDYRDVCRGHDVISLLGYVYGLHYHKGQMEAKMNAYYSKEDFYASALFASIQAYCNNFNIDAKVS